MLSRHANALLVIAVPSLIVAMLVTPADPVSMIVAAVPIYAVAILAYFFGFRKGQEGVDEQPSGERSVQEHTGESHSGTDGGVG